jgi:hypothetical protein
MIGPSFKNLFQPVFLSKLPSELLFQDLTLMPLWEKAESPGVSSGDPVREARDGL